MEQVASRGAAVEQAARAVAPAVMAAAEAEKVAVAAVKKVAVAAVTGVAVEMATIESGKRAFYCPRLRRCLHSNLCILRY